MLPASLMKANLQLSMRLRAYVQNLPGIKIWKTILWVVKVKNKEKKLTTTKTFFLTQSVKAVFLSHTLIWHAVFWKGYRLCFICDLVFSRQTGLTFSLYIYGKAQQRYTNCFLPSLWGWWHFICAAFRPLSNAKRCV